MQVQGLGEDGFAEGLLLVESRIEELRAVSDGSDVRAAHLLDLENLHEELRVADEELQVQQDELERLLALERNARAQHQRLVAALPAPVLVTDTVGVIRRLNQAAVDLLRTRQDALLGKPLPVMAEPTERYQLRARIGEARDGSDGFRMDLTLRPARAPSVRVEAVVQTGDEGGSRTLTWLLLPASTARGGTGPGGPALADALSQLARMPLSGTGKREVLSSVASICGHAFGPGAAVSVALGDPCHPEYVGSDGPLAQALDGAQMMAGEGPCQTAWEERRLVLTADLRGDGRWPRLASRIADQEVGAAMALPVARGQKTVGVLNLYAAPGRPLGEREQRVAALMAGAVDAILQEMDQKAELAALTGQLQEALESRAVIDQAKGMIMLQEGCDADAAFGKLVQLSSHANVKLRVIAQRIVDAAGRK